MCLPRVAFPVVLDTFCIYPPNWQAKPNELVSLGCGITIYDPAYDCGMATVVLYTKSDDFVTWQKIQLNGKKVYSFTLNFTAPSSPGEYTYHVFFSGSTCGSVPPWNQWNPYSTLTVNAGATTPPPPPSSGSCDLDDLYISDYTLKDSATGSTKICVGKKFRLDIAVTNDTSCDFEIDKSKVYDYGSVYISWDDDVDYTDKTLGDDGDVEWFGDPFEGTALYTGDAEVKLKLYTEDGDTVKVGPLNFHVYSCTCVNECVSGAAGCDNSVEWVCSADSEGCLKKTPKTSCAYGCNIYNSACAAYIQKQDLYCVGSELWWFDSNGNQSVLQEKCQKKSTGPYYCEGQTVSYVEYTSGSCLGVPLFNDYCISFPQYQTVVSAAKCSYTEKISYACENNTLVKLVSQFGTACTNGSIWCSFLFNTTKSTVATCAAPSYCDASAKSCITPQCTITNVSWLSAGWQAIKNATQGTGVYVRVDMSDGCKGKTLRVIGKEKDLLTFNDKVFETEMVVDSPSELILWLTHLQDDACEVGPILDNEYIAIAEIEKSKTTSAALTVTPSTLTVSLQSLWYEFPAAATLCDDELDPLGCLEYYQSVGYEPTSVTTQALSWLLEGIISGYDLALKVSCCGCGALTGVAGVLWLACYTGIGCLIEIGAGGLALKTCELCAELSFPIPFVNVTASAKTILAFVTREFFMSKVPQKILKSLPAGTKILEQETYDVGVSMLVQKPNGDVNKIVVALGDDLSLTQREFRNFILVFDGGKEWLTFFKKNGLKMVVDAADTSALIKDTAWFIKYTPFTARWNRVKKWYPTWADPALRPSSLRFYDNLNLLPDEAKMLKPLTDYGVYDEVARRIYLGVNTNSLVNAKGFVLTWKEIAYMRALPHEYAHGVVVGVLKARLGGAFKISNVKGEWFDEFFTEFFAFKNVSGKSLIEFKDVVDAELRAVSEYTVAKMVDDFVSAPLKENTELAKYVATAELTGTTKFTNLVQSVMTPEAYKAVDEAAAALTKDAQVFVGELPKQGQPSIVLNNVLLKYGYLVE